MRRLPHVLAVATQTLRELSDAASGNLNNLVKAVGGEANAGSHGAFLHSLLLLLRMLRRPVVQELMRGADASVFHAVTRSMSHIAHMMTYPTGASVLPEVMGEVVGLIEDAATVALPPRAPAQAAEAAGNGEAAAAPAGGEAPALVPVAPLSSPERTIVMLRRLAEMARARQHRTGLGPFWLRTFEDLLYKLCVNEGARCTPVTTL